MACDALSLGIKDDNTVATILLHDVCEDCGVSIAELPVNDVVKRGVELMTFNVMDGDNTLRPKNLPNKLKVDLDAHKFPKSVGENFFSVEEVGNVITQPGKELINKYNIEANSINEEDVPVEMSMNVPSL